MLQTHDDPNILGRQQRHQLFLKILNQLITSYNKQFLSDIKSMLLSVETELRPPHSFDNYPCGFSDCIYCHLKGLLQSNLQSLRDNVGESIERTVNAQNSDKKASKHKETQIFDDEEMEVETGNDVDDVDEQ